MLADHPSIPCLPSWPLLGDILALRNKRLELLSRISHEFGDIGAFHFGPRVVPLLNSPELVRSVLVEQDAAFEKTATVRALAAPVMGNGIFLSEGEVHRQQRKLLAPLFQHRRILNYAEPIINYTLKLQEAWEERNAAPLPACLRLHQTGYVLCASWQVPDSQRSLGRHQSLHPPSTRQPLP